MLFMLTVNECIFEMKWNKALVSSSFINFNIFFFQAHLLLKIWFAICY